MGNGPSVSHQHPLGSPPHPGCTQGANACRHAKEGHCIRVFFYRRAVQRWVFPNNCSAPFSARAQCHPLDPSPAGVAYVNSDFSLYKHPFELLRGVPCLNSLAAQHTLSASATGSVHGNEIRSQSACLPRPQNVKPFTSYASSGMLQ